MLQHETTEALLDQALAAGFHHHSEEALSLANELIRRTSPQSDSETFVVASTIKGRALVFGLEQPEQALPTLEAAYQLVVRRAVSATAAQDLCVALAHAYAGTGEAGRARALLTERLKENPAESATWGTVAGFHREAEEFDAAAVAYRKAHSLGGDIVALYNLADVQIAHAGTLLEDDPDTAKSIAVSGVADFKTLAEQLCLGEDPIPDALWEYFEACGKGYVDCLHEVGLHSDAAEVHVLRSVALGWRQELGRWLVGLAQEFQAGTLEREGIVSELRRVTAQAPCEEVGSEAEATLYVHQILFLAAVENHPQVAAYVAMSSELIADSDDSPVDSLRELYELFAHVP